jgi:hypothetical protein
VEQEVQEQEEQALPSSSATGATTTSINKNEEAVTETIDQYQ